MLWIAIALMTGAAVLCIVWPMTAPRPTAASVDKDMQFYRDQLRVLEADVENGLVPAAEAAGSRAEIGRRLLAAHDRAGAVPAGGSRMSRPVLFGAAVAVMVAIPAVSLATYLKVGAPDRRDLPLASRETAPQGDQLTQAIARVESHLASHPDDGRGFEVLAPLYLRLGRYDEAARAYSRALDMLGETAQRRMGYGQALMFAAEGVVTADARQAFEQAAQDDPKAPQPQFYLGLAAAEDGNRDKARTIWSTLVADAPADAPWLPVVKSRLAALDAPASAPATTSGPGSPAGAAIAALPVDQRSAMIRTMVDGLAARLAQDGHDKDGWLKLVRAYAVLGEKDRALGALADGRRNLSADPQAMGELTGLARELGLEG